MKVVGIIVIGVLLVVVFDVAASLIAVSTGIPYFTFAIGSLLIYVLFGFLTGLYSKWFYGAAAGAVIGLVESTLGWAISWYIGPGKPEIEMNVLLIAGTIIVLV